MRSVLFLTLMLFSFFKAYSHDDHDHSGESLVVHPQKGGVIQELDHHYLELVQIGKELRVYVYDEDLKLIPSKALTSKVILPRGRGEKLIELKYQSKHNAWVGLYEPPPKLHRYTLLVSFDESDHDHSVSFIVEPKRTKTFIRGAK